MAAGRGTWSQRRNHLDGELIVGVAAAAAKQNDVCPLKPQCRPKGPSRKIPRDIHEHARDLARSFAGTEAFEQSRRERKKIEMRFAHLKRWAYHANPAPDAMLRPFSNYRAAVPTVRQADEPDPHRTKWS